MGNSTSCAGCQDVDANDPRLRSYYREKSRIRRRQQKADGIDQPTTPVIIRNSDSYLRKADRYLDRHAASDLSLTNTRLSFTYDTSENDGAGTEDSPVKEIQIRDSRSKRSARKRKEQEQGWLGCCGVQSTCCGNGTSPPRVSRRSALGASRGNIDEFDPVAYFVTNASPAMPSSSVTIDNFQHAVPHPLKLHKTLSKRVAEGEQEATSTMATLFGSRSAQDHVVDRVGGEESDHPKDEHGHGPAVHKPFDEAIRVSISKQTVEQEAAAAKNRPSFLARLFGLGGAGGAKDEKKTSGQDSLSGTVSGAPGGDQLAPLPVVGLEGTVVEASLAATTAPLLLLSGQRASLLTPPEGVARTSLTRGSLSLTPRGESDGFITRTSLIQRPSLGGTPAIGPRFSGTGAGMTTPVMQQQGQQQHQVLQQAGFSFAPPELLHPHLQPQLPDEDHVNAAVSRNSSSSMGRSRRHRSEMEAKRASSMAGRVGGGNQGLAGGHLFVEQQQGLAGPLSVQTRVVSLLGAKPMDIQDHVKNALSPRGSNKDAPAPGQMKLGPSSGNWWLSNGVKLRQAAEDDNRSATSDDVRRSLLQQEQPDEMPRASAREVEVETDLEDLTGSRLAEPPATGASSSLMRMVEANPNKRGSYASAFAALP
ncbi:unnamed protein product [Amoebophrya sp. A25]|nr:unnamed protein product [Amoebophrya sp. A25]|eukprot:GSA25T00003410001.1